VGVDVAGMDPRDNPSGNKLSGYSRLLCYVFIETR
jgi:hypothetical protein